MNQSSLDLWINRRRFAAKLSDRTSNPGPVGRRNRSSDTRGSGRSVVRIGVQNDEISPRLAQLLRPRPGKTDFQISTCTRTQVTHIERLNRILLPMNYPRSFYKNLFSDENEGVRPLLASFHGSASFHGRNAEPTTRSTTSQYETEFDQLMIAGAITARLVEARELYILTLCTVSSFREQGIASSLLYAMIKQVAENHDIDTVSAHVWSGATHVVDWYAKRDFVVVECLDDYFRHLRPSKAFLMKKQVHHSSVLKSGNSGAVQLRSLCLSSN
jgi:ribosomal protein S18 acetylase RimI-like enzyme